MAYVTPKLRGYVSSSPSCGGLVHRRSSSFPRNIIYFFPAGHLVTDITLPHTETVEEGTGTTRPAVDDLMTTIDPHTTVQEEVITTLVAEMNGRFCA